jgi:hypothetical protein
MLDPVRMYARSLYVQETVLAGVAQIEAWCDDNQTPTPGTITERSGGGADADTFSDAWTVMLAHPDAFDGYPLLGSPEPGAFTFRPCVDLYGIRCAPADLGPSGYDPLDEEQRRRVLAAAVGETLRYDDPRFAVYLFGATAASFAGGVDVETVATAWCGYPPFGAAPDLFDHSCAEWRRPIRATEREMRRLLADVPAVLPVLRRWLDRHAGCDAAAHLGLRYPPCFGALIADIFLERYADAGAPVPPHRWQAMAAAPFVRAGAAVDPRQVYPVWLEFGIVERPDAATLTQNWSTADRYALAAHGGRFTAGFRADWYANRAAERIQ